MKSFLGIDPGSRWGWASFTSETHQQYGDAKFEGLLSFEKSVIQLISEQKAQAVITCRAMGPHAQVTRYHAAMAGVVELTCERMKKPYFDVADGTMRKQVIGKGNAKKPEVILAMGIPNEHAADAMVAARYLSKLIV